MLRKKYRYQGQSKTAYSWARESGINYLTLRHRLAKGMRIDEALTTPVKEQNSPDRKTGTKKCSRCKEVKEFLHFHRLNRRGGNEYQCLCILCNRIDGRERRQNLRKELILHYGNGRIKCSHCPESRMDVLDLDHINGGGIKHRKGFPTPQSFYSALKREGFPKGLRVLCRNCNWMAWIERKDRELK